MRHFHGQRGVFKFDSAALVLRNFSINDLSKSVPALNLSELKENDIVVLSQQPLMSLEEANCTEKAEAEESHQKLI